MDKPICPILSIGGDDLNECVEEECEWYIEPKGLKSEGSCAVRALAENLPALGKMLVDKMDKLGTKL